MSVDERIPGAQQALALDRIADALFRIAATLERAAPLLEALNAELQEDGELITVEPGQM